MRKKRAMAGMFGLSFVDCIASALGSVLFLVLVISMLGGFPAAEGMNQIVSLDIRVQRPAGTPATINAGGMSCRVQFFLAAPPEPRRFRPIVGETGGEEVVHLRHQKLIHRAWIDQDATAGWARLRIKGAVPGDWRVLVRLRSESTGPTTIVSEVRIGAGAPDVMETSVRLEAGRPVPLNLGGQQEGAPREDGSEIPFLLRISVPEKKRQTRLSRGAA